MDDNFLVLGINEKTNLLIREKQGIKIVKIKHELTQQKNHESGKQPKARVL